MRVDNLEINRYAACGPCRLALAGNVEHFRYEVGQLNMRRGATACRHIAHIACAARQIEQIAFGREVCRVDGFAQPALEKTEARYCVESRVLLRNIAEDMVHALFRNFSGRFGSGGGVNHPFFGMLGFAAHRSSFSWASQKKRRACFRSVKNGGDFCHVP